MCDADHIENRVFRPQRSQDVDGGDLTDGNEFEEWALVGLVDVARRCCVLPITHDVRRIISLFEES